MDAIELLHQDHQDAKKAMEQIARSSGAKKLKLFANLKRSLEMHDRIEEEIFYPSVHAHPKAHSVQVRDKEAHASVEAALGLLASMTADDPDWEPTFKSMQNRLLKHVTDEEHHVFARIRETLSVEDLKDLGTKMAETKALILKTH